MCERTQLYVYLMYNFLNYLMNKLLLSSSIGKNAMLTNIALKLIISKIIK